MKKKNQTGFGADAPKGNVLYLGLKHCFDRVTSLIASIVLLIPMAVIALAIVCKDFGNPFYTQTRVGQDGRKLKVVKFRSMIKNADCIEQMLTPQQLETYRREFKLDDDPRLIGYRGPDDGSRCFGGMLRRTSLDELPQIPYNIFWKGDMSVIGPRPILPDELEKNYSAEEQVQLLSVKPGLTGYWQAYARNESTYESGERQAMELYYVRNRSAIFDLKILIATVGAVLRKRGAK